ncbi:MAG TPA: hypothetical protein VFY56_16510 [Propionibacteriaceae bacterium]|nr:hypothetical protein [Propionibacteriaceae bacterium]
MNPVRSDAVGRDPLEIHGPVGGRDLSGSTVAAARAAPISWRTLLDGDSQYSAESTCTLIRLSPLVSSPSGNQIFSGAAHSRSACSRW